jgi:hypothetical protein
VSSPTYTTTLTHRSSFIGTVSSCRQMWGAAEEGTPFIPAHGMRRIAFTPSPAGFRFYRFRLTAGADLSLGRYDGQIRPVNIEPRQEPGAYDREIFLRES